MELDTTIVRLNEAYLLNYYKQIKKDMTNYKNLFYCRN